MAVRDTPVAAAAVVQQGLKQLSCAQFSSANCVHKSLQQKSKQAKQLAYVAPLPAALAFAELDILVHIKQCSCDIVTE
jgi:hypothetical protein